MLPNFHEHSIRLLGRFPSIHTVKTTTSPNEQSALLLEDTRSRTSERTQKKDNDHENNAKAAGDRPREDSAPPEPRPAPSHAFPNSIWGRGISSSAFPRALSRNSRVPKGNRHAEQGTSVSTSSSSPPSNGDDDALDGLLPADRNVAK